MEKIIIFDGVCSFCNFWVKIIKKFDKYKQFTFISNQEASFLLNKYKLQKEKNETIIYIKNNTAYIYSDAVLHIAYDLKGFFRLLYFFKILPKTFRNKLYLYISKNRYKFFGKESCSIS